MDITEVALDMFFGSLVLVYIITVFFITMYKDVVIHSQRFDDYRNFWIYYQVPNN